MKNLKYLYNLDMYLRIHPKYTIHIDSESCPKFFSNLLLKIYLRKHYNNVFSNHAEIEINVKLEKCNVE